jgi:hypothetical protein
MTGEKWWSNNNYLLEQQQHKKKCFEGIKKKSCAFFVFRLAATGFFFRKKKRDTNNISIEEWTRRKSERERKAALLLYSKRSPQSCSTERVKEHIFYISIVCAWNEKGHWRKKKWIVSATLFPPTLCCGCCLLGCFERDFLFSYLNLFKYRVKKNKRIIVCCLVVNQSVAIFIFRLAFTNSVRCRINNQCIKLFKNKNCPKVFFLNLFGVSISFCF